MDHRQYSAQKDPVSSFTKSSEIYDSPFRSTAFAKRSDKKTVQPTETPNSRQMCGSESNRKKFRRNEGKKDLECEAVGTAKRVASNIIDGFVGV